MTRRDRCYIVPETSTLRIVLATLCGVLVCWAGWIVYDYISVKLIARVQMLEHKVAVLEAEAKPMNVNHDSTVNYFLAGERKEE